MRRWTVIIICALVWCLVPASHARQADATTASTCPLPTAPVASSSVPWLYAAYQARFTPNQLAQQVYDCENLWHPATALAADVALSALRTTTGGQWQNENDWLVSATTATFETDYPSLGIPPLTMEDGPSGVRFGKPGDTPTSYPNEMALAATFDPTVASLVGSTMAAQAASMGFQGLQIPDLNVSRLPNWGRIMETFGENPTLAGIMGSAEVQGALTQLPFVVLKHFGPYSQESDRRTLTMTGPVSALMNNYLRSFAMAITAGQSVRRTGVMMMCSYGTVNTAHACTSPQLNTALSWFHFNGIVRSDLDVHTGVPQLWANNVPLVKPLTLMNLGPLSQLTAAQQASLGAADRAILAYQFATGLVTPGAVAAAETPTTISNDAKAMGSVAALTTELRGAVLLKNDHSAIPVMTTGPVVVVASRDFTSTCTALAQGLVGQGIAASCHVITPLAAAVTPLGGGSAINRGAAPTTVTTHVVVHNTGPMLISDNSVGRSTLTINGKLIDSLPGLSETTVRHSSVLLVKAGETLTCTLTYGMNEPSVWMQPLTPALNMATQVASTASRVIVLANDQAREGADRTTLALPDGQDQIIAALAAKAPTVVGLVTTGPVTLPWLSSVNGLVEFWNPAGDETADSITRTLVPAYVQLLTGQAGFQGHLPMTWPVSDRQSPLGGVANGSFFPGVGQIVNLAASPLAGNALGFEWYQRAKWPVAFPFGFGLTSSAANSTLSTNSCATPSPNALCLSVINRLIGVHDTSDTNVVDQIYVASPTGPTTPRLLLGGVASAVCRRSGVVTPECSTGTTSVTISNLSAGQWSPATSSFAFTPGCYSFMLATDATNASAILSGASPAATFVVHATAPFSSGTTLSPGLCPK